MKKIKDEKGITLIALVITIIVMLVLVGVTINIAVNGGLFDYAAKAAKETELKKQEEQDWTNLTANMSTEELIAEYTNQSDDLSKLRRAYLEGDDELRQEIEENIQSLTSTSYWRAIKYNNNKYKLTYENPVSGLAVITSYSAVDLLTDKMNVTQGISDFTMRTNQTKNLKNYFNDEVFEDFTITYNDNSGFTIDGYNITAGAWGGRICQVFLTGKTSGQTQTISFVINSDSSIGGKDGKR